MAIDAAAITCGGAIAVAVAAAGLLLTFSVD
jgi:hypothetical protein